jgi:segregation and condensation protein B
MDAVEIKYFVEAAMLAAGRPLSIDRLQSLFDGRMTPEKAEIRAATEALNDDYGPRRSSGKSGRRVIREPCSKR